MHLCCGSILSFFELYFLGEGGGVGGMVVYGGKFEMKENKL